MDKLIVVDKESGEQIHVLDEDQALLISKTVNKIQNFYNAHYKKMLGESGDFNLREDFSLGNVIGSWNLYDFFNNSIGHRISLSLDVGFDAGKSIRAIAYLSKTGNPDDYTKELDQVYSLENWECAITETLKVIDSFGF